MARRPRPTARSPHVCRKHINGFWCRSSPLHRQLLSGRASGYPGKTPWRSVQARSCEMTNCSSPALPATRIRMELDRIPLWRGDHVAIKQLVRGFCSVPLSPSPQRTWCVAGRHSRRAEIADVESGFFAYAESFDDAAGRYRGLRCCEMVNISESNLSGLLVRPEVALKQHEAEKTAGLAASQSLGAVLPADRSKAFRREARAPRRTRRRCSGPKGFTGASPSMPVVSAGTRDAWPTR